MRLRAVYLILFFNFFVFIMMLISNVFTTRGDLIQMLLFLRYGAQYGPRVSEGDWFRLITALFVHGGIFHVLFNSYALYYFGSIVESFYGPEKFFVSYLASGIAGNLATHFFYYHSISVGASGAIFGLIGMLFVAGFKRDTPFFLRPVTGLSLLPIVLINIVYGFLPGTNINNAAHLGGFLMGMVMGYIAKPLQWRRQNLWRTISMILLVLVVLSYVLLLRQIPQIDDAIRSLRVR